MAETPKEHAEFREAWSKAVAHHEGDDRDTRLSPTEKIALLFYIPYRNRDQLVAWTSARTVAEDSGVSERVVKRAFQKAERLGFLVTISKGVGGQGYETSRTSTRRFAIPTPPRSGVQKGVHMDTSGEKGVHVDIEGCPRGHGTGVHVGHLSFEVIPEVNPDNNCSPNTFGGAQDCQMCNDRSEIHHNGQLLGHCHHDGKTITIPSGEVNHLNPGWVTANGTLTYQEPTDFNYFLRYLEPIKRHSFTEFCDNNGLDYEEMISIFTEHFQDTIIEEPEARQKWTKAFIGVCKSEIEMRAA